MNKREKEEEEKERQQIFERGKKTIRSPDIKKISEESEGKTSRTEGGRKEMEELKELMREMMKQIEENMLGIRQEIKEMKKEMGEKEKKWEKEKEKLLEEEICNRIQKPNEKTSSFATAILTLMRKHGEMSAETQIYEPSTNII
ncbi:hypothetical protein RN001_003879 [Aquatica leii]|uniref:Uncharacterized protein n=1 Tax=Aquatica leii TaxID=1421715 RepID=A0AAN7SRR2_9COLE|nr:hypothetical protein RN001_003879 [Aquatica leii]